MEGGCRAFIDSFFFTDQDIIPKRFKETCLGDIQGIILPEALCRNPDASASPEAEVAEDLPPVSFLGQLQPVIRVESMESCQSWSTELKALPLTGMSSEELVWAQDRSKV